MGKKNRKRETLNIQLDSGDVSAVICALSTLPSHEEFELFPEHFMNLPGQIILKLSNRYPLNKQDITVIAYAVNCAYRVLCNEMASEDDAIEALRPYLFTIINLAIK